MTPGTYAIPCRGEVHRIRINNKGRARFLDHEFSIQDAAKEFDFLATEKQYNTGCLSVAGFLAGKVDRAAGLSWHPTPSEIRADRASTRELTHDYAQAWKSVNSNLNMLTHPIFFEKVNAALKGSLLYQKAKLLFDLKVLMEGPSKVTRLGSTVTLTINAKRWARLALMRATVVEGFFIIDRMKIRSNTDVEVKFMKRSRGTLLVEAVGNIRLGSDKRWRFST